MNSYAVICSILSVTILVNGSFTAAISSQQHIQSGSTTGQTQADKIKINGVSFVPKIRTDKKKAFCENKICHVVQNFSLTDIAALDCYERFLSIEFEVTSSVVVIGFIDSNSNEIYLKQENSKICSKIKRYIKLFF
jgi:hypothetical protein